MESNSFELLWQTSAQVKQYKVTIVDFILN